MINIRKAVQKDINRITQIYEHILDEESAGRLTTGWIRGVYPNAKIAADAVARGDMYVYEDSGVILASAIINHQQVDVYSQGSFIHEAPDDEIMVIHTLTVEPEASGKGIGRAFVEFYENLAIEKGCSVLRFDTNEKNTGARALYGRLGYREAGIVPCVFNGIPDVMLVLFEKPLKPCRRDCDGDLNTVS